MSIDIAQLRQIFFDESFDGLDAMESGLLELNKGFGDPETINTIFRAAHSIKSDSGTIGFTQIPDFTYVLETLLDEMRKGQCDVSREVIQILLQSVDCLREMLIAARDNKPVNREHVSSLQHRLKIVASRERTVHSRQ